MNVTSIGDMAQGLMLRSRTAEIKSAITRLTDELSSGQVNNVAERLGGDFAQLASIDKNLAQLKAFNIAASEARMFTDVAQESLSSLQDLTTALGADVISSVPSQLTTVRQSFSTRAEGDLQRVLTTLNTNVAGRSLFSGIATDTAPIQGTVDDLLDGLRVAISGLPDAADIQVAADDWFADPAGFRATMYAGADIPLAPVDVGPGDQVRMELMADDETFRDLLKAMALTALATDPALGLDVANQNQLILQSGEGLLSEQDAIAALRSDLGYSQSRIDEANARNSASVTSFEIARATLLASDPYDTATQLEEAQFQLESLYAATVRTSRLSLLNFF
jgi:flagellar hook-associated protein 3 FlgL